MPNDGENAGTVHGGTSWSHYLENEKNHGDPRGLGPRTGGGDRDAEMDVACPFCGADVENQLHRHLPCSGVNDAA